MNVQLIGLNILSFVGFVELNSDVKCLFLVDIDAGYLQYDKEKLNSPGGVINVTCNKGFTRQSPPQLTCQEDGMWDEDILDLSVCVEKVCPYVMGLQHGTTTPSCGTPATPGCKLDFKCDASFKLDGATSIECMENLQWSEAPPKCIPNFCYAIATFENGKVEGHDRLPVVNTTIKFSCNEGFELVGHDTLTCQEDRQWSHDIPKCQCGPGKVCALSSHCPTVVSPHFGGYKELKTDEVQLVKCYPPGSKIRNPAQKKYVKCVGNQWESFPDCSDMRCPHWEALLHGKARYLKRYMHYAKVGFRCEKGYYLVGDKVKKCMNNSQWEEGHVECRVAECPTIKFFEHGTVVRYCNKRNGKVVFKCDDGYTLNGPYKITCLKTDQGFAWSSDPPVCDRNKSSTISTTTESTTTTTSTTTTAPPVCAALTPDTAALRFSASSNPTYAHLASVSSDGLWASTRGDSAPEYVLAVPDDETAWFTSLAFSFKASSATVQLVNKEEEVLSSVELSGGETWQSSNDIETATWPDVAAVRVSFTKSAPSAQALLRDFRATFCSPATS